MKTVAILILMLLMFKAQDQHKSKTYVVSKVDTPISIDADWDKADWKGIEAITLENFMGDKPEHFPKVKAKLAYDERYIYAIWKVEDQYVRAVADQHQGPVFQDSCVEFFFIPDNLGGMEYFNLEMNCGGTMLFHHQEFDKPERVNVTADDISKMKVAHSLPRLIPDEITEETTWYLEYAIPFDILKTYYNMEPPISGSTWRANFYKCADKTSHPHWLTWSPVDFPKPRFHLPEFFGSLLFE